MKFFAAVAAASASIFAFAFASLCLALPARGQGFSFSEDPVAGLPSNRISLPEKQGTVLGLAGKTIIEGNSGDIRYDYTIAFPVWRSLFPNLVLTYNSQGGYGVWGQGFSDNVPFIERSRRMGVPSLEAPLNASTGGELVQFSANEYRARIEGNFQRYLIEKDSIRVMTGNGNVMIYGADAAARESEGDFVTRWNISEIQDPVGAKVRFFYKKLEGSATSYLQRIAFVENSGFVTYAVEIQYENLAQSVQNFFYGVNRTISLRPVSVESFWIGGKLSADSLATEILSKAFAQQRFHANRLVYMDSGLTKRSLLKEIKDFGRTDSDVGISTQFQYAAPCMDPGSECKVPISFQQTYGLPMLSTLTSLTARFLDMNSDGLLDILSSEDVRDLPQWSVSFNKGVKTDGSWAGMMEPTKTALQSISFKNQDQLIMDLNGDRKLDLLIEDEVFLNQGGNESQWASEGKKVSTLPPGPLNDPQRGAWVDLNGDSRTDFVLYDSREKNGLSFLDLQIYWNISTLAEVRFSKAESAQMENPIARGSQHLEWSDLNADGLPELLFFLADSESGKEQVTYWLNTGRGNFRGQYFKSLLAYKEQRPPRWFDLNGDGYTDALVVSQGGSTRSFLSDGKDSFVEVENQLADAVFEKSTLFEFGDVNANGSKDLVIAHDGNKLDIFDPYLNHSTTAPFLLLGVSNNLGQRNQYSYQSSARYLESESLKDRMPVSFQVAETWNLYAAATTQKFAYRERILSSSRYFFRLGYFDNERNEFLGFKAVEQQVFQKADPDDTKALPNSGILRKSEYYTGEKGGFLRGKLLRKEESAISDGSSISKTLNTFVVYSLFPEKGIVLPLLKETDTLQFEGKTSVEGKTTFCTRLYKGEHTIAQRSRTDYLNGEPYRVAVTNYREPGDKWLVNFPKRQMLFAAGDKALLLGKSYEYNPDNCKLQEMRRYEGNSQWTLRNRYDYDSQGNLIRTTDAGGHTIHLAYQGEGGFLPSETSQRASPSSPLLVTKADYDFVLGGALTQLVDENGKVTRVTYDGLSRLREWFAPSAGAEPTLRFEYVMGDATHPSQIKSFEKSRELPIVDYLDGNMKKFARVLPSDKAYILDVWNTVNLYGDPILASTPQPLGDLAQITGLALTDSGLRKLAYDERGRIVQKDIPSFQGARALYKSEYAVERNAFASTSIDPTGTRREVHTDALGRTVKTSEPTLVAGKTVQAEYEATHYPTNNIRELKIPEHANRLYLFDRAGRLSGIESADFGSIKFEYTILDFVRARTIKSQDETLAFSSYHLYDEMGRILESRRRANAALPFDQGWNGSKVEALYTYDESVAGEGNLDNVLGRMTSLQIFPGARYHFGYDDYGNRNTERLKLYKKIIETRFEYGENGRLESLTYPDGEQIHYTFSARTGMADGISELFPHIERDALNRPTAYLFHAEGFSPDVRLSQTFDEISGYPTSAKVEADSVLVQHNFEDYDLMGRIKRIVGNDAVVNAFSKAYAYDIRGQLAQADLKLNRSGQDSINEVLSYEYTLAGDVLKLGDRALSYDYDADRHLQTIRSDRNNESWEFDALGRIRKSPTIQKVGWESDSSVACIQSSQDTSRYAYFPDGLRFSEVMKREGKQFSTAFVNPYVHYHKESDSFTKFYKLEGQKLATRKSGELQVIYRDYIHSGRMVLGTAGKVKAYYDYRPFGKKLVNQEDEYRTLAYQFADHYLNGSETYQMGLRLYDPGLGRFLTSDLSMLGRPADCLKSPLDCNSYNYARNDPINYVDNDGRNPLALPAFAIGFLASATSAYVTDYTSATAAKPFNLGTTTAKAFIGGFIAGTSAAASTVFVAPIAVLAISTTGNVLETIAQNAIGGESLWSAGDTAKLAAGSMFEHGAGKFVSRMIPINGLAKHAEAQAFKFIKSLGQSPDGLVVAALARAGGKLERTALPIGVDSVTALLAADGKLIANKLIDNNFGGTITSSSASSSSTNHPRSAVMEEGRGSIPNAPEDSNGNSGQSSAGKGKSKGEEAALGSNTTQNMDFEGAFFNVSASTGDYEQGAGGAVEKGNNKKDSP